MHVCVGYDDNDNDGENDWYVDDVDYDRNIDMIMSIAHTGHSHHACVWRAFLQRMHVCHCKSQIRSSESRDQRLGTTPEIHTAARRKFLRDSQAAFFRIRFPYECSSTKFDVSSIPPFAAKRHCSPIES